MALLLNLLNSTIQENVDHDATEQVAQMIEEEETSLLFPEIFDFYYKHANPPFNNSSAQNMLAVLYGRGIPDKLHPIDFNHPLFISWLQISAKQDNSYAWHNLGLIYKEGTASINVNLTKAIDCFEKSSNLGNCHGDYTLALIYRNMHNLEKFEFYLRRTFRKDIIPIKYRHSLIVFLADEFIKSKNLIKVIHLFKEFSHAFIEEFFLNVTSKITKLTHLITSEFLETKNTTYIDLFLQYLTNLKEIKLIEYFIDQFARSTMHLHEDDNVTSILIEIGYYFNAPRRYITISHYLTYQKIKYNILYKNLDCMNYDCWNLVGLYLAWFQNVDINLQ